MINLRKNLIFKKHKEHSHLFGGSRDKLLSFRWNQTPNPIEITVIGGRKVKERLPKARYAINVSILDGLGGNDVFYKFVKDVTK
jgi:hypothetical protein